MKSPTRLKMIKEPSFVNIKYLVEVNNSFPLLLPGQSHLSRACRGWLATRLASRAGGFVVLAYQTARPPDARPFDERPPKKRQPDKRQPDKRPPGKQPPEKRQPNKQPPGKLPPFSRLLQVACHLTRIPSRWLHSTHLPNCPINCHPINGNPINGHLFRDCCRWPAT